MLLNSWIISLDALIYFGFASLIGEDYDPGVRFQDYMLYSPRPVQFAGACDQKVTTEKSDILLKKNQSIGNSMPNVELAYYKI